MSTMPRTIINLDPEDKQWLDQQAKARQVPMTQLVREAVRAYRLREESRTSRGLDAVLQDTAGLWRQGDALAWQRRLRAEWDPGE